MRARTGMGRGTHAGERGFVLVGVVMFVLALTILGLSLYAISGYEGQFLTDTQAEEQALFRAEGGMAMAQSLLQVPPYSLTQSHYAEGYEGVERATAWQIRNSLPDSTGNIDWTKNIFLRISTRVGNQTRVVEQEFTPQQRYSPYRRLFTAREIDYTPADGDGRNRTDSAHLNGPRQAVWQWVQNSSDTSWVRDVNWDSGRPMLTVLLHAGVGEIAAVVTRYYGGTKLGTGGLARAYSGAVQEALSRLERHERVETTDLRVRVGYHAFAAVRHLLPTYEAHVLNERYDDAVELTLRVPVMQLVALRLAIGNATGGQEQYLPEE